MNAYKKKNDSKAFIGFTVIFFELLKIVKAPIKKYQCL